MERMRARASMMRTAFVILLVVGIIGSIILGIEAGRSISFETAVLFTSASKVNAKDCKNCDHPKVVSSGSNLYVAYSQAQYHFIALSSDAGASWRQATVDSTDGR